MTYAGPERRHYRVFVTDSHEYHLRDGKCIAVRVLATQGWNQSHRAVGAKLATAQSRLRVGDELLFEEFSAGHVRAIERPRHFSKLPDPR